MSQANRLLLLLLAAQLALGGFLAARRLLRPAPPEADWSLLDPVTAGEIRAAVAGCKSAADWRRLGELYMAAGCFRESEVCHRVACDLAPRDPTLARQWAFALERLALLDDANAQYRRALDLGIANPDACRYFIGRNLLRAEKPGEARAVFAKGKALDANRYELARLHLRAGEFTETEGLLRELAADRPGILQLHLLGHRLALERGDARRAFLHADAARYAPNKLLTPFDEEAARVVEVTQRLGPGRHWKQGRDLIEVGRLDEAEKMLREAGQVYWSPAVNELLAEVALRRGRFDEAIELLEDFQARNGPAARIIARIGDAWDAAGQSAKARANWLRAVQLEAALDLKSAHHKLAESFAAAGDRAAADRHRARVHYHLGRDLLHVGQARQARDYFGAAIKQDAQLTQAWFYLGEARRLTGQEGPAASAYRACLRLNPDHGRALASLAFMEGDKGKK